MWGKPLSTYNCQNYFHFPVEELNVQKAYKQTQNGEGDGEQREQDNPPHRRSGVEAQVLDECYLCSLSREAPGSSH